MKLNLFATVLTYAAPSSNYRGETEENRTIIQKLTIGDKSYPVISPESMRNALREILARSAPCNRRRLHDEDQMAVEFREFPDAEKYADDFLFGYLVADQKAVRENRDRPAKRDSVLRMNLAVGLTPYRFDTIFHQSPKNGGQSPFRNATGSALLRREVAHTAFQYPFALAGQDCEQKPDWVRALLSGIGELSRVAGGHARSSYEMAPASIVARLTPGLIAGFDSYGFREGGDFPELERIKVEDLPGEQFWVGGEIVRKMSVEERERLRGCGVRLYENPQRLLADLTDEFLT